MKKYFLLVMFVALFASLPLFGARFIPTHDGEYHVIRFWQFYRMLSFGYMFPRWAPDLNSGYGLPLFIFHYPLPNYIGSLWHFLGVSFVDSVKLTLAFGYLAAITWCFLWLRKIFSDRQAMIGTIICSVVPYWFVDMYVRGSVGEVWALSFVLFTLFSLERNAFVATAIGIAGIILSHNITALIFVPLMFLYILFRRRGSVFAVISGVLLSSYFWLPALFEQRFMVGLNSVSYADHFPDLFQLLIPSWGTGFSGVGITSDEMSYQIGVVPLIILCLSFFAAIGKKEMRHVILPILCITLIAIFGMTEYSQFFWSAIPFLQNIQYPWRLLMVPTIAVGYLTAALMVKIPRWVMYGLTILSCLVSFSYMRPVTYEKRTDIHYLSSPNFTDGTSSLGNSFTTIYTSWKKERFTKRFQANNTDMTIKVEKETPLSYTLSVNAQKEASIAAQILYFPGWKAYVDEKRVPIAYLTDGLITIVIPAGTHVLHIRFVETPIRLLADWVSFLSLFSLLSLGILKSSYANRNKHTITLKRPHRARRGRIHRESFGSSKKE